MPAVDVCDDTFVAVAPELVARHVAAGRPWQLGLRGLRLRTALDRGRAGRHWWATARFARRRWAGTAELWLEPWQDGTLVHLYVRLDPWLRVPLLPGSPPLHPRPATTAARSGPGRPTSEEVAGLSSGLESGLAVRRLRRRVGSRWKLAVTRWKDELESAQRAVEPCHCLARSVGLGRRPEPQPGPSLRSSR